ncbi:MAG: recombinase family protein [Planctomycetaceae bacterium]|nr:recombinase family protein [Planctomycetaceae bacterium]
MTRTVPSTNRPDRGRGLFYSRDSGGRHDQTPAAYVEWASNEADKLGVRFSAAAGAINELIASGAPFRGDLYFDNIISGNQMSRPALDALKAVIRRDHTISHLFIPRRDRLARPDDAAEGVALEREFREAGVTLVFHGKILPPLKRGQRQDVGEALAAYIDYDASGRFRDELAEKMLYAQVHLARQGFSTGGRAPFGFRRHLAIVDGTVVRALNDGEIVRQRGHHVVWLPGPDDELDLIRRILTTLETVPATQVARMLNREGIPSPDAGRTRRDNGVEHAVSGLWHPTTITGIARNPLIRATTSYGRRAMGDRRRISLAGPREMEDDDYLPNSRPKVIQNPKSQWINGTAKGQPIIPREQDDRLQQILDTRGGTQMGRPRSRDPQRNPLGVRIFDMACGWPMYRVPRQDSFRYTCGYYQQTNGDSCSHNSIDGPLATRFALAAVRQTLLNPDSRQRLIAKLRQKLATRPSRADVQATTLLAKRSELSGVERSLATASKNMVLAGDQEMLKIFQSTIRTLQSQAAALKAEIEPLERAVQVEAQPGDQLEAAMACLDRLPDLAADDQNLGDVGRLFQQVNLQLFLRFTAKTKTKRTVNKLAGGVLTTGSAAAPIEKYAGPTGRRALQSRDDQQCKHPAGEPAGCRCPDNSDRKAKSLGNQHRDDRI